MNQAKKIYNRCNIVLIATGSFLIFSSIGSYFFSQTLIKKKVHENVIIKENSSAYNFWISPPATIIRKYYLFDIRNPIEVENGEKPQLVQRGPYVYSEKWEKRHVEFLSSEIISFTPIITLKFEPSLSAGNESDPITFLNVPAMGMIEQTVNSRFKELGPTFVNSFLALLKTKLFITKTAGELISGYHDPLMELAKIFLPKVVKDDKFSLLNGKNGTEWQNYTMMTGNDYAANVARILSWNGFEKLNFWGTESANSINGTDGTFFPPFLSKDKEIQSFNPDMCRSYKLTYLKENELDGIKTYDFHLPKTIFYGPDIVPDNKGFCLTNCLGNGVLNISSCYGGISGFVSQPHFLNADEKFVNALHGLKPDENLHDFILHLEPTTSVPIAGNIRLQINFYMLQSSKIDLVKKVQPALIPMFWFDEEVKLDSDTRSQLKTVAFYVKLVNIIPIIAGSIGLITILSSFIIIFKNYYSNKASNQNINQSPDETTSLLN